MLFRSPSSPSKPSDRQRELESSRMSVERRMDSLAAEKLRLKSFRSSVESVDRMGGQSVGDSIKFEQGVMQTVSVLYHPPHNPHGLHWTSLDFTI